MSKWYQNYFWLCLLFFSLKESESTLQLWKITSLFREELTLQALQNEGLLDIWSSDTDGTKVVVESENAKELEKRLNREHLDHSVLEIDFLSLVDEEMKYMKSKRRKRSVESMDWSSYHKLQDIEGYLGWLNATASRRGTGLRAGVPLANGVVDVVPVAVTEENRHVYVIKVSDPSTPGPKVKIWIEGGIHAREWISPSVTTFLLHQVATSKEFAPIIAKSDWYFVPVANPDGYAYSFRGSRARMWRKNRSKSKGSRFFPRQFVGMRRCRGGDLNRNWDYKFGVGASSNPCSDTYKGTNPFSEPETEGLRRYMEYEAPFDLFITLHSYGQSVLYPWGWTKEPPPNVNNLIRMGRLFVDSVRQATGTNYTLGGSGIVYGLASGASDDWAYGALETPYSYTIELRDTGTYGFQLPENQIFNTVHETTVGIHCMASYLVNEGRCGGGAGNRRRSDILPDGPEPRSNRNRPRRRQNRVVRFKEER